MHYFEVHGLNSVAILDQIKRTDPPSIWTDDVGIASYSVRVVGDRGRGRSRGRG